MKVILLEEMAGLGKKYDIKDVAGGYARNVLFPKKLAELATPEAIKKLEAKKANLEKEELEIRKHLKELARRIGERRLEFHLKTGEQGAVFGSVNKETILNGLRDAGLIGKERVEIKLDHPIKNLGEEIVEVDLKKGIKASLKILILPQK